MRASIVWAAAAVLWSLLVGSASAQDKTATQQSAEKFCAAEYGDRLLGVTMEGENGFSCRFAAVEKITTYQIEPTEPEPKWDLDEEAEAAVPAVAVPAAKPKTVKKKKAKVRKKKRRYSRAKTRTKKRTHRKTAKRTKQRDPVASWVKRVKRATNRKRAEIRRKLKKAGFNF